MKKSKRTWLLLAGVAALSATLLVPTVLSACSSTPENENPGDGNKPGDGDGNGDGNNGGGEQPKPNKLAEEIQKLNETNNKSARKNIYTDYFKAVNKPKAGRLSNLTPPNISKPTIKPLTEIVKNGDFFDALIEMIKTGLDTGENSQNGQITSNDLNSLIENLNSNKSTMTQTGNLSTGGGSQGPKSSTPNLIPGSIWSPTAFEFNDADSATWTFISNDTNTVYELFLTENVDFTFASTSDSVSVKVSNKPGSDKVRSRVVVTTKKTTSGNGGSQKNGESGGSSTQNATYESKSYNFKSDTQFALPSMLFEDFTRYIETFDANVKQLKDYFAEAIKKYKDLTTSSNANEKFASAATIWNQFVSNSEEALIETMKSDLNTKRSKSKIFEWIKSNVDDASSSNQSESTSIITDLQSDLEAAKSVDVTLDTLLIKGQNADNNGLNNATNEEPDYTLIISFEADEPSQPQGQKTNTGGNQEVTLDEKWYILNLKATGFEFSNNVNNDFFGYQDASLVTTPKLKLDAKSGFASYKFASTGDNLAGNELVTVTKIKSASLKQTNEFVDVSNIYDIDGMGFSSFISDLVIDRQSENTKLTDKLIDINAKKQNTVSKFKEYLKSDADAVKKRMLEPDVLADLILNNIDVTNLMFRSAKFGYTGDAGNPTDTFPTNLNNTDGTNNGWRNIINNWVKGGANSTESHRPDVFVKTASSNRNTTASGDSIQTTLKDAADIVVQAKPATGNSSKIPPHPLILGNTNKDYTFRSIYIFLGNDSQAQSLVSGSMDETKFVDLNVELTGPEKQPTTGDKQWSEIKTLAEGNFCIVFEKAKFHDTQATNTPPVYGFYMGQRKVTTSVGRTRNATTQSKFSISLDSLLGDGSKFLKTLLGE